MWLICVFLSSIVAAVCLCIHVSTVLVVLSVAECEYYSVRVSLPLTSTDIVTANINDSLHTRLSYNNDGAFQHYSL